MLKDLNNSPAASQERATLAILFISTPPESANPMGWYWRDLAGVPFLLRNVLNIQRGGVQRLVLYMDGNPDTARELHHRCIQDPRVQMQLEWQSDSQALMQITHGARELLFLEGSALYDKATIRSAVGQKSDSGNNPKHPAFFLARDSMASLLEAEAAFNFTRLEQVREQSLASGQQDSLGEKPLSVYLPEACNPKILSANDFQLASERIIKKSAGLSNDSFATRILSRPLSRPLTKLLLSTPVTPNQITLLSFALGLVSAGCFFQGGYQMGWIGALILLISIWMDGVDGEIARIKFMESTFGGKLDIYCDNIVHIAVFFSIGMGLYHIRGGMIYLVLGGVAALGSLIAFLMLSAAITEGKSQAHSAPEKSAENSDFIERLANRDFTYFLLFLALVDRLDVFLWLTAIGVNILAAYLLFSRRKTHPPITGA